MKTIWLIGTGLMGIEYAKVLNALGVNYIAIGRGEVSAKKFEAETGHSVITGGIDNFLSANPLVPNAAIVAVGIEALTETAIKLLEYGVSDILQEKPGVGYPSEINELVKLTLEKNANVLLAYNRRFYSSVLKAQEIILEDGGISSFNFEFTEWSHIIKTLEKTKVEHNTWFLGNSTHVIDTAFYLGGKPKELVAFYKGGMDWHPASSVYSGAGISETDALFSYQANWEAPGRWVIEMCTKKHRLIFKPMETLQIQNIGSVAVEPVIIDNQLDIEYKPGIYLQTEAFINGDYSRFCSISNQKDIVDNCYLKMSGYK
jgi:predicted dehydrogenase